MRTAALALVAGLTGCAATTDFDRPFPAPDGALPVDLGRPDASEPADQGAMDAGGLDRGVRDAGQPPELGPVDGAAGDGGAPLDLAPPRDAGPLDAAPLDATPPECAPGTAQVEPCPTGGLLRTACVDGRWRTGRCAAQAPAP